MSLRKTMIVAAFLMVAYPSYAKTNKKNIPADLIVGQLKLLAHNYQEARNKTDKKDIVTVRSLNSDGSLNLIPSKDWCSGFFPGSLWLGSLLTGDKELAQMALRFTAPLEQEKFNGKTHDMGFKMMCSFGLEYKIKGDSVSKNILIQSAKTLATRFNEKIGAIRSWDHSRDKWDFPVIIDNMMNLELLFWASKQTGDQRFYNIAVKHAQTTLENHFRTDNSSFHVVDYDSITGKVIKKTTHQGFSNTSAWARGQAWGLYGYTMCFRETQNAAFLSQAEKIAEFILHHPNLPIDMIPYWDFDAPEIPSRPRDVSAAAIIASALFELANYIPTKKTYYLESANTILKNLTEKYMSQSRQNMGFLLGHSTGSFPQKSEVDVPINYADYYFLEALLRQKEFSIKNSGKK